MVFALHVQPPTVPLLVHTALLCGLPMWVWHLGVPAVLKSLLMLFGLDLSSLSLQRHRRGAGACALATQGCEVQRGVVW